MVWSSTQGWLFIEGRTLKGRKGKLVPGIWLICWWLNLTFWMFNHNKRVFFLAKEDRYRTTAIFFLPRDCLQKKKFLSLILNFLSNFKTNIPFTELKRKLQFLSAEIKNHWNYMVDYHFSLIGSTWLIVTSKINKYGKSTAFKYDINIRIIIFTYNSTLDMLALKVS